MRRLALPVAGLAGLAIAVAVVPAIAADQTVDARSGPNRFEPPEVTINPGDTVTFRNNGGGIHNLHWEGKAEAEMEPGAVWTYERKFDTPGTYRFYCDPHQSSMRGVVNVTDPNGGGGTTTTSTTPPPGGTTTETTPPPPPGGTTTSTTPPPGGDTTPPSVSNARARATRRGVRVVLSVSEPARITLRVLRRGRRVARRTFDVDEAGAVVLRVRRALRRGRYSVRLALVDAAGNASTRRLRARVR